MTVSHQEVEEEKNMTWPEKIRTHTFPNVKVVTAGPATAKSHGPTYLGGGRVLLAGGQAEFDTHASGQQGEVRLETAVGDKRSASDAADTFDDSCQGLGKAAAPYPPPQLPPPPTRTARPAQLIPLAAQSKQGSSDQRLVGTGQSQPAGGGGRRDRLASRDEFGVFMYDSEDAESSGKRVRFANLLLPVVTEVEKLANQVACVCVCVCVCVLYSTTSIVGSRIRWRLLLLQALS